MTRRPAHRRLVPVVLGLAALVAVAVPAVPAGAVAGGRHLSGATATNSPRALAARQAGVGATLAFGSTVGTAALGYGADLRDLAWSVASGDLAAARADELAAQGRYDALRFLAGTAPSAGWEVDGLAGDAPSGRRLTGLHLVEEDLWDGGDAAAAVSQLVATAPLVEAAYSRLQASPEEIESVAVDELGWVNEVAVPGRAEPYSHLDTVDIAATVGAARAAYEDLGPLVQLLDSAQGAVVTRRFDALAGAVGALGAPGSVADTAIPAARLEQVAQDDDAAAAALSALGPTLAGYGPRQIYGYNA
ncbi:MAG: hypothetical protein ACLP62_02085 [Acidimicrobiales bacterium]